MRVFTEEGFEASALCRDSEDETRLTSLNADRPFAESVRRKKERTKQMKKLMIAAALVAATIGAQAEDCSEACPFGYQIKIMVKTTATTNLEAFNAQASDCKDTYCLRVPATRRFAGFIYGTTEEETVECPEKGCACNEWDEANLVLWNYDSKQTAKVEKWELLQLDRILDGDTTTFEMAFDIDQLRFGGFGKVAKRPTNGGKWTIKNASGFCAGLIPQMCSTCKETTCGECTEEDVTPVAVWGICDNESAAPAEESETTVAYGKWTIDWSSTVYNRVLNKQDLTKPGAEWGVAEPVTITSGN